MIDDFKKDATTRMGKCVLQFQADLKKLRTGRAHPSLVENLRVDYYGSESPLQQLANISVEDARTLVISPWDKGAVQAIEKAIYKSELGLTPNTAGMVIRVPLPPLTEERRKDMIRVVRGEAEGSRVAIRNIRRDAIGQIKELMKEKMVSEDEEHKGEDDVQKLTDEFVAKIDSVLAEKEKELLEI
jgi:ribosome recycling factor